MNEGGLLQYYNFLLCESDDDELATDAAPGSVEAFEEAEAEALRPRLEGPPPPPPWRFSWRLLWWRCLLNEDPPIERTEPPPESKTRKMYVSIAKSSWQISLHL